MKKAGFVHLLDLFWRGSKGGEGVMLFGVCKAPLNNWANGGSVSVDDFYKYGEYGFSFNGSWSYLGNAYGI